MIIVQFLLIFVTLISSSPVVHSPSFGSGGFDFGDNYCLLPPELGQGSAVFLEECETLERFPFVPKPESDIYYQFGIHPVVCCPEKLDQKEIICFESDPYCPNYKPPVYDYPEDPDYEYDYIPAPEESPKVADGFCPGFEIPIFGALTECVTINSCPQLLENSNAPHNQTLPCGFDETNNLLKICCPKDFVQDSLDLSQSPRFKLEIGSAREVEDKSDQCRKWKRHGACKLDQDFQLSEKNPSFQTEVGSKIMFEFMQKTCLKTCGWAPGGCYDEHERCQEWSRLGHCVNNPSFMAHTCRESCGVCGFLSSTNEEEQVVNGLSYSDYTKNNFDCGRFKSLSEINGDIPITTTKPETGSMEIKEDEPKVPSDIVDLRDFQDVVFNFNSNGNCGGVSDGRPNFFCGATVITDRWLIAAAHCYRDLDEGPASKARLVRLNTIRDNTNFVEQIEMKRVYNHPKFSYPSLYDDIAVIELGRRISYDVDKYGDTPVCIDQGKSEFIGKLATVQGYGCTENGTRGSLLEANVTVISNEDFQIQYRHNLTNHQRFVGKLCQALPTGMNDGFLGAKGILNERGVFTGSCIGDSGGPLMAQNEDDRRTLIGIVSGGVSCGRGFPGWYTKVSFYKEWINCIIEMSSIHKGNHKKVEEECNHLAVSGINKGDTEIASCPKS